MKTAPVRTNWVHLFRAQYIALGWDLEAVRQVRKLYNKRKGSCPVSSDWMSVAWESWRQANYYGSSASYMIILGAYLASLIGPQLEARRRKKKTCELLIKSWLFWPSCCRGLAFSPGCCRNYALGPRTFMLITVLLTIYDHLLICMFSFSTLKELFKNQILNLHCSFISEKSLLKLNILKNFLAK